MKLKKLIINIGVISSLLITSCKKQIELIDPQGLPPAEAVANDANIKKTLQGAYDAISSSNLYGGNIQLFSDLLAANGEITWYGTFNTYREVWGKNILTTNPLIASTWSAAYRAINIANTVLENVDKVNTQADKDRVRGEALFIRAAMHFELVRFYAKDFTDGNPSSNPGVPLIKKATNTIPEITTEARSSVQEVYNAVIADLVEAESLLPRTNGVFATKSAAGAILARVYLQKADYAGARDAANRAINNATGKSLLPNFMDNFNQAANTQEDIFAIQVSDQDGANNLQLFYAEPTFGGRGDIEVEPSFFSLYSSTDVRRTRTNNPTSSQFSTAFYSFDNAYFYTTKWRDLYKNVKVVRLAELYLIRAEANTRLGTAVGATPLEDYNRIRTRAGLVPSVIAPSLQEIYNERRRELAFEGFGIHDARRFKITVDGRAWNDNKLVFPIPFREMNANNKLTQNPGYN